MKLCNQDCNNCPVIGHPNSRMLSSILNKLYAKLGDEVYNIVQKSCPNMTCCYDCKIDDFCHIEKCDIVGKGE